MKKFGFTISEIIVSLTLIGVISGIIMPGLVQNYKKEDYTKRLQIAISNFERAMATLIMNEGVDDFTETKAWKSVKGSLDSNKTLTSNVKLFTGNISSVLPIIEFKKNVNYKNLTGDSEADFHDAMAGVPVDFYTKNGVVYKIRLINDGKAPIRNEAYLIKSGISYSRRIGYVLVDVNGDSEPNRLGRDIFFYEFSADGRLYPYGGVEAIRYNGQNVVDLENQCKTSKEGHYCAAYLAENRYEMDY